MAERLAPSAPAAQWIDAAAALDDLADGATECIVLDGVLREGDALVEVMARALRALAPNGSLLAVVASARNFRHLHDLTRGAGQVTARGRYTRRAVLNALDAVGADVTSVEVVRDHDIPWVPLPLEGTIEVEGPGLVLRGVDVDAVEELTAAAFVVTARHTPSPRPRVSLVVVIQEATATTRRCLEAILSEPPSVSHELVVVDNGSGPETQAFLDTLGPDVLVLSNPVNCGFATAANRGARTARGDLVAFLHDDAVPHRGWLDRLVQHLDARPDAGAAGPKLVYPDGSIFAAGIVHGRDLVPYSLYRHHPGEAPYVNRLREVPGAPDAAAVVRRRLFAEVGGFDEAFDHGLQDADLCLRLRARHHPVLYCPAATVTHAGGGTPRPRTFRANVDYFARKWEGRLVPDDGDICRADGESAAAVYERAWHLPPPGRRAVQGMPPVVWSSWVFDRSGYANEARSFIWALDSAGVDVSVNPVSWPPPIVPLPPDSAERLWSSVEAELPRSFVHVCHLPAAMFQRHPASPWNVGRTMWETDVLPDDRVERCNEMDELWVPSEFNVEVFRRAGVPAEKLVVVPEPLDTDLYLDLPVPAHVEGAHGFTFLAVFAWSRRKGWDVLVRAFVEEFAPTEDVSLVLAVSSSRPGGVDSAREQLGQFLRFVVGRSPDACPTIVFLPLDFGPADMPPLYCGVDAYVLPSRGEGWGRPYMEAMATGLPTIGTRWSGNTEFMDDSNSFLVDYELVDVPSDGWREFAPFRGQRWAEPSLAGVRDAMRRVIDDPDEASRRGAAARGQVLERYGTEAVGRLLRNRLGAIGEALSPRLPT